MVMQLANDMSTHLNIDAERREKWLHIRNNLVPYPTQQRNGKTVFRYTEKGLAWVNGNSLGLQHIYPAGQIGLESPPELLEIAKNTVLQMRRWNDSNATNSVFPAAVRVGIDPAEIWRELENYSNRARSNGFQTGNPHGVENWSTVPNTVNEMLCTGHQSVIRLFHAWPKNTPASFHNIRTEGAFLISAKIENNLISDVVIVSEKGRPLTLQNPWHGKKVKVSPKKKATFSFSASSKTNATAAAAAEQVFSGPRITLETKPNTTYTVSCVE
jgi:hypothetical protein